MDAEERPSPPAWRRRLSRTLREGRSATLWGLGLLVGVIAGYGAIVLRLGIDFFSTLAFGATEETLATVAGSLPAWRVFLAPVLTGGVIAALLYIGQRFGLLPQTRARNVADLIETRAVGGGRTPLGGGLYSALVSAISLGGGASAGREGPAVHLGGALASFIGARFGLDDRGARILLACGAAAAVAASFNAPVAGALFAFEVVLGHYALRSIAPVAAASVTGAVIAKFHFGPTPAFPMPEIAPASLIDYPAAALLGVAAAGLAVIFVRLALHLPSMAEREAKRFHIPLWSLPLPGGAIVGLIAIFAPEVLGVGYEATSNALAGQYGVVFLLVLLLLKVLATGVTLASRFGGGVFSPSLYLGAVLGAAFGAGASALLGDQTAGAAFFAVVGMGAVSGAVLGAPLSTTLIVFELTSSYEASVAVLVAVSLATALAQAALNGSFFQKQIHRRGYDLTAGAARVIPQIVRVADFMTPAAEMDVMPETDREAFLHPDNTLNRALDMLKGRKLEGVPVRTRGADQSVIGWVSRADAHAAHARALAAAHEEEHR